MMGAQVRLKPVCVITEGSYLSGFIQMCNKDYIIIMYSQEKRKPLMRMHIDNYNLHAITLVLITWLESESVNNSCH